MPPPTRPARSRAEAARERRERRATVTDSEVVMEAAAAFLAVRPRSVAETRRRLRHLGYPTPLCAEVVDRLAALGYLDDHAFARAWVESRDRTHPRGAGALRRELQEKGIAGDVISEVLAERASRSVTDVSTPGQDKGGVELEAARRLLERRASSLRREADPRRQRQRAYALLARHGFAPDVCRIAAAAFDTEETDHADRRV